MIAIIYMKSLHVMRAGSMGTTRPQVNERLPTPFDQKGKISKGECQDNIPPGPTINQHFYSAF